MAPNRIVVALPQHVADWVTGYSDLILSPSYPATLSRIIDERRALHQLELRRIPLTEREAETLANVLNGTTLGPGIGSGILYGELVDAFHLAADSPYGEHHGIDEDALLAKIRGIGPSADLALREAFARWWNMDDADRSWEAVGLHIIS